MENVFLGQSTVSISKKETVKLLFIKLKIWHIYSATEVYARTLAVILSERNVKHYE